MHASFPARLLERPNRILANRQVWKRAIYGMALLTYCCSFLFFVLAAGEVSHQGPTLRAVIDILAALYFLIQVIFLFTLSAVVERRRRSEPISFADRRRRRLSR